MNSPAKSSAIRHCLAFTRAAAIAAIAVAVLVFVGWLFDIAVIKAVLPRCAVMKPNTALSFIFCGVALWLTARSYGNERVSPASRKTLIACAIVAAAIGGVTLCEHLFGFNAGVDRLLFPEAVAAGNPAHPGRMSPASASAFLLLGSAIVLLNSPLRRRQRIGQCLALAVGMIGLIALNGYIVSWEALYRTFAYSTMALHTATLFVLLGFAASFSRPEHGIVALITSSGEGGRIARWLLPVAIVLPIVLGTLELFIRRAGWMQEETGGAFFAAAYVFVFTSLILLTAGSLYKSEAKRRRAETRNHQLAAIVNSSEDAIIGKSLEGNITSWNGGAERLFGYTEAEMLGRNISLLVPPEYEAEQASFVPRVGGGETVVRHETVRRRKDGSLVDVSLTISPIFDEANRVVAASVIAHDISERKYAEAAVRLSEARFAGMVNSAMDAIVSVDEQNQIVLFNPAAEKMFGVSAEEIRGQPLGRLLAEASREVHLRDPGGDEAGEPQPGRLISVTGRRAGGEEFPIEVSLSQIIVGGQNLYTAIMRDVTERKRNEEQLRAQAMLLEMASDGIIMRDLEDRVLYWNKGAERIFGFTAEEMVGRTTKDQIPDSEHTEQFNEARHIVLDRGEWAGEWPCRSKLGETLIVESRWTLLRDDHDQPKGVLALITDITHKKRLEAQFFRAQRLESIGTLAGGIAHDFNNILAGIMGSIEVIGSELPRDHPVQEFMSQIRRAGQRGADLVRRILTFSHQQGTNRELVRLETAVTEALKLLRATLPTMFEIRTSFAPNIPPVMADVTQVHQVIMNLGANSAHAMGGHAGVLDVRIDCVTAGEGVKQTFANLRPGRYVRLSFSDTGSGMDKETIDRIFEPFFTTKAPGEGTGLGLAVVHGIMRSHDGDVTVASQPGQGTSFRLYFPVAETVPPERQAPQPEIPRGNGEHILYVDDEEPIVVTASRILKRLGYEVTAFQEPAEALADFRSRPDKFSLVITDISMPDVTGFDLAQQILELRPNIPVILTTGYSRPQDAETAQKLGIRHTLLKPATAEQLAEVVRDCLARRNEKME